MAQTKYLKTTVGALFLVSLGVVGGLLSIPFLINEPYQVVRPGAPALLANTVDGPADIEIRIAGTGEFMMLWQGEGEVEVSEVLFVMPRRNNPPQRVPFEWLATDMLMATGRLDMPGLWRLTIAFENEAMDFDFMLAEY